VYLGLPPHKQAKQVELTQTNQLFQYLPEGEQGQKSSAMDEVGDMEGRKWNLQCRQETETSGGEQRKQRSALQM